jgi:hypothetical protein
VGVKGIVVDAMVFHFAGYQKYKNMNQSPLRTEQGQGKSGCAHSKRRAVLGDSPTPTAPSIGVPVAPWPIKA